MMTIKKQQARTRKRQKIRAKISGTTIRPRLSIFKSNKAIYAQLIDDEKNLTLAAAFGSDAKVVGEKIAKVALDQKIKTVVFDRGGYIYQGKISALAQSARKAGLKF